MGGAHQTSESSAQIGWLTSSPRHWASKGIWLARLPSLLPRLDALDGRQGPGRRPGAECPAARRWRRQHLARQVGNGEIGPPSRAKLPGLGKGVPAPRPVGWDSVRGLEPGGDRLRGALSLSTITLNSPHRQAKRKRRWDTSARQIQTRRPAGPRGELPGPWPQRKHR